ncbi:glycosyl transferase [candidate division KSB1 bacterium]|nr:glycosyl transferase [candidate division KSB1 bacterium]NIR69553.1 glycosyl transferase [candidate division KSB1 bacterium]NIS25901.1 glycosyl transferase [candidate division KSB1 bacterium]NIT72782.1 glycosyl transferase [candidate division KSB1 bacterium]NIU26589.1 glycosyl transferase [candidate division KSB1 bacterium]
MADFYQSGALSTFHRFGTVNIDRIENELESFKEERPVTLVLPAIYDELKGEALKLIVEKLKKVEYLKQIIITMGRTNAEQFQHARQYFSVLPQKKTILWATGPRIQTLIDLLEENELSPGPDGKGRSAWFAFGYALTDPKSSVIALHDCDILTYDRELLARLCYPVSSPNLSYEFNKGYYARVSDRMHGRVTRLLVSPLLGALIKILGPLPYLNYMDGYRYPLAGEFCLMRDLARVIRIPSDWGLEVGILSEIFKTCSVNRICQTELCEVYDHKHQPLSPEDPEKGLLKMCIDITKTIFRQLAAEGVQLSGGFFRTLRVTYLRTAQEAITRYEDDAAINGLQFDRHAETQAIEAFTKGIQIAADLFIENPLSVTFIPTWTRVTSAIPDFFDKLEEAVKLDNK